MTTKLKIGTVLIAKDSFRTFIKGNEYTIVRIMNNSIYQVESDSHNEVNRFDVRSLNDNFTIKRYTLTDLKEKKIAVLLKSKKEIYQLAESLSLTVSWEHIDKHYRKIGDILDWANIEYLTKEGYELLESIDEIDLEEKEHIVDESATVASFIKSLEEQIEVLKMENQQLRESPQISQSQQSERTRMAWEFYVHNDGYSPEKAFKAVDSFLAKSKEVGNG